MKFSERMGIESQKQIQTDDIDQTLRNRILNYIVRVDQWSAKFILDRLGMRTSETFSNKKKDMNFYNLKGYMTKCPWYKIYEIFEYYLIYNHDNYPEHSPAWETNRKKRNEFTDNINRILEEERSGYRIVNGIVAPLTNPVEIDSIEQSMFTVYPSVNTHFHKALELYSKRPEPDYENTIKESISAVEAMCSIIVGKDTTLGKALNQLEKQGIVIHEALKDAYSKLYGYTSDEKGIRHAGIEFSDAPHEDAKYMLVVCSAFVNYLTEKFDKSKENRCLVKESTS
ncbi:MAG TPA: hypothetical protein PK941_15440 [Paludibacter sp.]|nr:hypothetical protein [Paludibacter sp.]